MNPHQKPPAIKRDCIGEHPWDTDRWQPSQYRKCYATVVAIPGHTKVAISMNGTAVMTKAELTNWYKEIMEAMQ